MNPAVTSQEEILRVSRQLLREQGWQAVNIRSVAGACGVSVGAIYNYFDSKAELVTAVVESVWCELFRPEEKHFSDVLSCIRWLYQRLDYGSVRYPGFFTLHSVCLPGEERENGKARMQRTWAHILESLHLVLQRDPNIRPDAFDQDFTAGQMAEVLFSQLLSALLRQDYDPSTVLELVRRTLYRAEGTGYFPEGGQE